MRHISNNRRGGRGKSNSTRKSVHPRYQNFESNGPDGRLRGTPSQIHEKFSQQARDAQASGDMVRFQSLLQYAEHYFRIGDLGGHNQTPRQASHEETQVSQDFEMAELPQEDHRSTQKRGTSSRNPSPRHSGHNERSTERSERTGRPRRSSGRYTRGDTTEQAAFQRDMRDSASPPGPHDTAEAHEPGFGTQMPAFLSGGQEDYTASRSYQRSAKPTGETSVQDSAQETRPDSASQPDSDDGTPRRPKGRRPIRRTPYGTRRRVESRTSSTDE